MTRFGWNEVQGGWSRSERLNSKNQHATAAERADDSLIFIVVIPGRTSEKILINVVIVISSGYPRIRGRVENYDKSVPTKLLSSEPDPWDLSVLQTFEFCLS